MKLLFDDCDEHVGADGALDLRLPRILAGAQELLDPQMLLDPLEEQLDLPAVLVELGDHVCRLARVVGQKDQTLAAGRVVKAHPAQMFGMPAELARPLSATVWSHTTPVVLSTLAEYSLRALKLDLARVTKKAPA